MSHNRERRIIIVGKTGNGKSSLGNNLLRKQAFDCRRSKKAVTTSCKLEKAKYNENEIKIVDTPGLFSPTTGKNVAKQALDILESLDICNNPHAFLLVMRDDCRCTEEDLSTEDVLEITFGPEFFQRAIIVFTHVENEIPDKQFEEDWKESSELTSLIEKCGNRVARIENTNVNSAYINHIFSYVEEVSKNGSEKYLNIFENCQKEVLQKMAKLDKFDGKNAREQVSSLCKKIKQAIEKEEQTKEIKMRQQLLERREESIAGREQSVSERERNAAEREESFLRREENISRRELSVTEKEDYVSSREESVQNEHTSILRRETSVTEREEHVSIRERSTAKEEEEIEVKTKNIVKKEREVKAQFELAEKEKGEAAKAKESAQKGIIVTTVASGVVAGIATAATGGVGAAFSLGLAKAGVTGVATSVIGAAANWVIGQFIGKS